MRVSFDFDFTLSLMDNSLNKDVAELFRGHMIQGDEIFIITSRHFSEKSEAQIHIFLDRHNLEAIDVFHTEGPKIQKILDLGIEKHFDDDLREIVNCEKHGIEAVNVFDAQLFKNQWVKEFGEEPLEIEN